MGLWDKVANKIILLVRHAMQAAIIDAYSSRRVQVKDDLVWDIQLGVVTRHHDMRHIRSSIWCMKGYWQNPGVVVQSGTLSSGP